jgi:hypothetical protein
MPLAPSVAEQRGDFGWHDLHLFTAPKIDRVSIHRFFIKDRLREHLCLLWPGPDYDLPALGLDIYEHPTNFTLVADFIPFRDLAYAHDYYERYYGEFGALIEEFWPRLYPHFPQPMDPPKAWFDRQLGSALAIHHTMNYSGLQVACEFQTRAAELWCQLWQRADVLQEPARSAYNQRRPDLIATFRAHDYNSGASKAMARVVGQETTEGLFNAIFGP